MSRISVPPAPRHLVQLWRTSGSDVPKSSATAKRLRPAVHLVRSFPTTVPAKPTQTIPARDKVLVSHNMLSHILGFLAVPQAAGVRAVCRYWLRCGSQALHHAILEWFELPLQLSEWGKYPTVSIDMEDSKEPYSQPLHRISHTLLEQRIAFPDWGKKFVFCFWLLCVALCVSRVASRQTCLIDKNNRQGISMVRAITQRSVCRRRRTRRSVGHACAAFLCHALRHMRRRKGQQGQVQVRVYV